MKKSEQCLRVPWNIIKWINEHIMGTPEGEERERVAEIFEELMAENSLNLMQDIV